MCTSPQQSSLSKWGDYHFLKLQSNSYSAQSTLASERWLQKAAVCRSIFYPSHTFVWLHASHVQLDTRPSHFSACNTEKLGGAWGQGYGVGLRVSLVLYPARICMQKMVWCTKLKYLAPFHITRNVQSNCRMITSSHRIEIVTYMYRARKSIVPCVEAGHRNGNPITGSIILTGLIVCHVTCSLPSSPSIWTWCIRSFFECG